MSNTKNAGVAGGVVLLMLWGGIGFFFGKGKGKGDNDKQGSKANIEQRVEPRRNPVREPQPPQPPRTATPAPVRAVGTVKVGTPTRETFTYVLRLTFIHPLTPDGKVSEATISEDELIAKGKQAKIAKKELHLKIKGDARAKWLNRLKHKLKQQDVAYSISNDY